MTTQEKKMVSVDFSRDQQKNLWIEVQVRSVTKPNGLMIGKLDTREIKNQKDIKYKIEVLAGALSEEIAIRFKDRFIQPDKNAVEAGKEWDLLLQKPHAEAIPM